jgi:hypothetical protein
MTFDSITDKQLVYTHDMSEMSEVSGRMSLFVDNTLQLPGYGSTDIILKVKPQITFWKIEPRNGRFRGRR